MKRGRELVAVVATATLAAVALTFPFAAQMTHVGRIDNFDGAFGIWNVAWVARTLVVDPLHVFDANIFFPNKGTLVYSETNLGAGALAIPAYWATRNPYFTFNFMFLLSMVLSATGMYYLVRHLVQDRRAAAVSGLAFGFCAYVFAHTPQMQLLMTAGLPFSLLAFHRLADRPGHGRAAVLGSTMAAQVAFCGYYAVFVMLMIPFAAVVVAATRGWWTNWRYWGALAVAAIVAVVAALPVLVPYMRLQQATGFERELAEAARYSADWRAYFASAALAHRWMLPLLGRWNEVLFPGFVALIAGMAGLGVGALTPRFREVAILYGLMGGLMFWASFGPEAGLYTVLYETLPPFSLMRAPARFGIVVTLTLCVLAGISVRALLERIPRPTIVGALLALVTAAELAFPLRFRQIPPVPPAYTRLASMPKGPVIELPFYSNPREWFAHARYMLNSTTHWMPLVNGYSDYVPPQFREAAPTLRTFPSAESFDLLAAQRPRYAVFHMGLFGEAERAATAARIAEYAQDLSPIYTEGDVHLYEIVRFR